MQDGASEDRHGRPAHLEVELLRLAHEGRERQVATLRARLVDLGAELDTALHDVAGLAREAAAQQQRAEFAEAEAVAQRQRADALGEQVAHRRSAVGSASRIGIRPLARVCRLLGRRASRRFGRKRRL